MRMRSIATKCYEFVFVYIAFFYIYHNIEIKRNSEFREV